MKKIILDKEEQEIEDNIHKAKPVSKEKLAQFQKIIAGSRRSHAISLRISGSDLEKIKEKASLNGLPYQTMINVVLHKYVTDSFLEKHELPKYFNVFKKAS